MICDYDGKEIAAEPYKVRMWKPGRLASGQASKPGEESPDASEIGYRYFHDATCFELFAADEEEYRAVDLPGSQVA